jgi:hypothetical protein
MGQLMTDKVIDNPILNRPYDEPSRHLAFDDGGITDRIEDYGTRPRAFRRRSPARSPCLRPQR